MVGLEKPKVEDEQRYEACIAVDEECLGSITADNYNRLDQNILSLDRAFVKVVDGTFSVEEENRKKTECEREWNEYREEFQGPEDDEEDWSYEDSSPEHVGYMKVAISALLPHFYDRLGDGFAASGSVDGIRGS